MIEVIEVTIEIIDHILTSIKIDSERNFHVDKFRLTQTIFLHRLHKFRNTTAPGFHKPHLTKNISNCFISDF